jgi:hypothetical protein
VIWHPKKWVHSLEDWAVWGFKWVVYRNLFKT